MRSQRRQSVAEVKIGQVVKVKCAAHGPFVFLTIVHRPGKVRPQPADMIRVDYPAPARLLTHRADHGIQLPPGDAGGIGPVQRTASPAALSTVPKALDSILELVEVQWFDLARAASAHGRLPPAQSPLPALCERRRAKSQLHCQGVHRKGVSAFASTIMASTRSMRSFFFRPVHTGGRLQVGQHIL